MFCASFLFTHRYMDKCSKEKSNQKQKLNSRLYTKNWKKCHLKSEFFNRLGSTRSIMKKRISFLKKVNFSLFGVIHISNCTIFLFVEALYVAKSYDPLFSLMNILLCFLLLKYIFRRSRIGKNGVPNYWNLGLDTKLFKKFFNKRTPFLADSGWVPETQEFWVSDPSLFSQKVILRIQKGRRSRILSFKKMN